MSTWSCDPLSFDSRAAFTHFSRQLYLPFAACSATPSCPIVNLLSSVPASHETESFSSSGAGEMRWLRVVRATGVICTRNRDSEGLPAAVVGRGLELARDVGRDALREPDLADFVISLPVKRLRELRAAASAKSQATRQLVSWLGTSRDWTHRSFI